MSRIKVGQKYYTESQLLDYINFYNQNFKMPDINNDIKAEILKSIKSYPQISKSTYRPNLYYEQYCNMAITYKEFKKYVLEENPVYFHFYGYDSSSLIIYIKNHGNIEKLKYNIYSKSFAYTMYENVNDVEINDSLESLTNYIDNTFYFDILSMKNIYNRRTKCVQYNPNYAKDMIIKFLDNLEYPKKISNNKDVFNIF